MYVQGQGVPQDFAKAEEWLRRAAEQDHEGALRMLDNLYNKGILKPKYDDEYIANLQSKAEQGDAEAQNSLGLMYMIGEGIPQNYDKAVEWLLKSEAQGNMYATHNLGTAYYINQNHAKAVEQWRIAAEQGHVDAIYCMGMSYSKGEGVSQDYDAALRWFLKAAQPGCDHDEAQYAVGDLLENVFGDGREGNLERALEFYGKAAEQGNKEAQEAYDRLSTEISKSGRKRSYTKEEIIEKVHEALQSPTTLYRRGFVNYSGKVGGQRYTEIIARELSKNMAALRSIPTIHRQSSYKVDEHEELADRPKPENSNRDEEWFAIGMYGKTYKHIGKVIDFQTPLKAVSDSVAGKIDLLSYNEEENTAYILELKKIDSKETLLRCVLETYTYWKTVDGEKLLRDFGIEGVELRKAVLLFNNCTEYEEYLKSGSDEAFDLTEAVLNSDSCLAYKDFLGDDCDNVYALMTDKLKVDLFILNAKGNEVIDAYRH
jgi:TPR repeat protein